MEKSHTKWTQKAVFMYPCVHMYTTIIIKGKTVNLRGSKGGMGSVRRRGYGRYGGREGKGGNDVLVFN